MKQEKKGNNSEKSKLSRKQKILITSIALLTGFSGTIVGSSLIAYNSLFSRYERPDYSLVLGNYCYERVENRLKREEFYFNSKVARLKGYFYKSENAKGIVVVAHGFHAGADDYLPIIEYLVNNGFSVFSYDVTGTYDSEGDGTVGWCQSLIDIDYALRYIASEPRFNNAPLFLLGHSWGGYAVTSVLAIHKNVKACVGIAPMRDATTIMIEKSEQYVGKLAEIPKPIINAYQKSLFKEYMQYNAIKGINSVNIPVLIAHGIDDKVITYGEQSIIAEKDKIINSNVKYLECFGLQGGHDTLWHSIDAIAYQKKVESQLEKLKIEKKRKLTNEEKAEFYKTVNHDLYSAVNEELMREIILTFNSAL